MYFPTSPQSHQPLTTRKRLRAENSLISTEPNKQNQVPMAGSKRMAFTYLKKTPQFYYIATLEWQWSSAINTICYVSCRTSSITAHFQLPTLPGLNYKGHDLQLKFFFTQVSIERLEFNKSASASSILFFHSSSSFFFFFLFST